MTTLSPATTSTRAWLHDITLKARTLLLHEIRSVLEGVYGIDAAGKLEDRARLPALRADATLAETRVMLEQYLAAEKAAGVGPSQAVTALEREVAFTWLNRLTAFKMLEARSLIRPAVGRGRDSVGFKLWLAEDGHAEAAALAEAGDLPEDGLSTGPHDRAYRAFLLSLSAEQARDIRVLFDPASLVSRLAPRPRTLKAVLALVNTPSLEEAWREEETIGWIYQFFNEEEKDAIFARLNQGKKIQPEELAPATQLFTPRWIVQALVENSLGRLWLQMHPDSRLGAELAALVVDVAAPPVALRPVREITLLDPACGTMHFGLVAFDLFYEMYLEELAHAGEPGWPSVPSVASEAEISTAIIANNLYGMDIDLRAVQLAALALLLKARGRNREAHITAHHLVCASVRPAHDAHVEQFLAETQFAQPIYTRLVRGIWQRLADAPLLGSLMRLEADLDVLIQSEREKSTRPTLPGFGTDQFETAAGRAEFWHVLASQVTRAFDDFATRHASEGLTEQIFTDEATRGFALFDLMLRRYDVVCANPPYMYARGMPQKLGELLKRQYTNAKNDLYAAFIARSKEYARPDGRIAMITQQSFMSTSRYEALREDIQRTCAIESMVHIGPHGFVEISGEKVNTVAFVLRREANPAVREQSRGTYLRLVREGDPAAKQHAYGQAVRALRAGGHDPHLYHYRQGDFAAISGAPWVYYITPTLRDLFRTLPKLGDEAKPKHGLSTCNNFRYLRFQWEIGNDFIDQSCLSIHDSAKRGYKWFPYMKGGSYQKWWGNQEHVVNWVAEGKEIKQEIIFKFPDLNGNWGMVVTNPEYYFQRGVTWTFVSSGTFNARLSPGGFIFDVAGSSVFPADPLLILAIMNSTFANFVLRLINPTVNFQVGDLARLPIPTTTSATIHALVERAIALQRASGAEDETTYEFVAPPPWGTGLAERAARARELAEIEAAIDAEVYRLYGISAADRAIIAAELARTIAEGDEGEPVEAAEESDGAEPDVTVGSDLTLAELALRWVSYAVGIVLGRFTPGDPDALGRGTVTPEEALALRSLVIPDGLAALEAGHPQDLATAVQRALAILLGDGAAAVLRTATGDGDLREWLVRDFWKDHLKRYRKRPIYWLLQSPKRRASYLLFHERASVDTLNILTSRRFVAGQLALLDAEIARLQITLEKPPASDAEIARQQTTSEKPPASETSERRRLQRALELVQERATDLHQFDRRVAAIVQQTDEHGQTVGWRPARDDGVLINLAPLHTLIPSWAKEPRDCWAALESGAYDWSHTAMRYWPDRVRRACATNPSYALAHAVSPETALAHAVSLASEIAHAMSPETEKEGM